MPFSNPTIQLQRIEFIPRGLPGYFILLANYPEREVLRSFAAGSRLFLRKIGFLRQLPDRIEKRKHRQTKRCFGKPAERLTKRALCYGGVKIRKRARLKYCAEMPASHAG